MRSAEHQVDDPTMGNNAKLASWRANMKTSLKRAITDGGAADFDPPTAKEDRPKLALVQQETPAPRKKLEFWESEKTRPEYTRAGNDSPEYFRRGGMAYLKTCMEHPFLPVAKIRQQQFERIYGLVEMAYYDIPVYRDKYKAAGFSPSDLRTYDDIQKIPVITKPELIAAFPTRCLNPHFYPDDLFATRSSGSSGQTLLIRVDYDAVLTDTIQGIRQFALQSGNKYRPEDLLAHVYTVPWWYDAVDGKYPTAFISNVIPPARVAKHLREIAPRILSCYPSNLEALLPHADEFRSDLYLAVTHSEYSSRHARKAWAERFGCPVLDEYSSEEATRIALEMPGGNYHVCEDSVHLDVLDPATLKPQIPGESGLAVITNLLNGAMPFIRYVQGDLVTQPANPGPSDMNWSQISSIDGRMNDAFINKHGRKIPAGSLLDVTYRWMFDRSLHLAQFELVQKRPDLIEATFVLGDAMPESRLQGSVSHLEDLLGMCLEHPVNVKMNVVTSFPAQTGKRRPIRCEVKAS
jgi:phenylacetate-CoA ligase